MSRIRVISPSVLPNDQLIIREVESNKIHLVCLALKKNFLAVNLMVKSGLFDFDRFYSFCDLVNSKSEVGCFRPYMPVNLSLFPLHQSDRSVDFESKKLVGYFNDTLIANQEYVRASKMVYVFDVGIWDGFNLEAILRETVEQFPHNEKYQGKNIYLTDVEFYCV
jgi:hypothetical protein